MEPEPLWLPCSRLIRQRPSAIFSLLPNRRLFPPKTVFLQFSCYKSNIGTNIFVYYHFSSYLAILTMVTSSPCSSASVSDEMQSIRGPSEGSGPLTGLEMVLGRRGREGPGCGEGDLVGLSHGAGVSGAPSTSCLTSCFNLLT